ncbi:hypothetical protein BaRGS_00008628 [Batillaria attramentaria]|uniref:Cytochrome P450 n=1 Tax=Batillaria attramentaria TaxID=370345 RepID=A0ABD0LKL3_9CAEN
MSLFAVLLEPTSLLAVAVLVLSLLWWRSTRRPPGLPPGPGPALPLLGHLHLLDKDPRPKFREWRRQYGDVFSLYMGGQLVVVLNGYHVIKEALVKHADVFSDRPSSFLNDKIAKNRGVVGTSGTRWKEQRKVSLEILREMGLGKNVLAERVQEEVTHYIKALNSYQGRPADVGEMTHASISNNICSIVFGRRFEYDDPTFTGCLKAIDENVKAIGANAVINFFPWLEYLPGDLFKLKRTLANVAILENTLSRPQVKAHVDTYTDGDAKDFIHAYIREIRKHKDNGQTTSINEENLVKIIGDLFVAGTETTASVIRWALVFFLHNPDVQDKCYDEIQRVVGTERAPSMRDKPELTYVEATVMEVLRKANVGPFAIQHGLSRDVTFHGYTIPKDAVVLPFQETALTDPEMWDEPTAFRPERFIGADGKLLKPDPFIPFSIGRRVCLGESLARMELFLYLATMIQHFRFLPPEDGQLPSLEGNLGLVHSPKPFQLRAVLRE